MAPVSAHLGLQASGPGTEFSNLPQIPKMAAVKRKTKTQKPLCIHYCKI